jgi:hypothetical protein
VLSVITWLPFTDLPFWVIWLGWCGPTLLFTAIAALFRQPRGSSEAELPAEYLRYEQRHPAPAQPVLTAVQASRQSAPLTTATHSVPDPSLQTSRTQTIHAFRH